jgi:NTE family protein
VGHKHIIRYNDGITSDHVIASASVPLNYSYTTLEVESYNEKNIRHFWDGGVMSTTPSLLAQSKGYKRHCSEMT